MLDPFAAVATLVLGVYKEGKVQGWCKLVFTLLASGLVTFLFVCGGALISPPHSWAIAIGSGMVLSAVSMTVVFRKSPLTKGMLLVLPEAEATKELETDLQVIEKPK